MDCFTDLGTSFHLESAGLHLYLLLYEVAIYLGQMLL